MFNLVDPSEELLNLGVKELMRLSEILRTEAERRMDVERRTSGEDIGLGVPAPFATEDD